MPPNTYSKSELNSKLLPFLLPIAIAYCLLQHNPRLSPRLVIPAQAGIQH